MRIDTAYLNMHQTLIANNELTFTEPLVGTAAIRAGASQGLPGAPGGAIVTGNRIVYTASPAAPAPAPTATAPAASSSEAIAIELVEGDFNTHAHSKAIRNSVSGPFDVGIALVSASANSGIIPVFEVAGNRFWGLAASARLLKVERDGEQASAPTVRWDAAQTRNGRATDLARALAGGA